MSESVDVDPGHPDHVIEANTGRTWQQWVEAIDAGPGRDAGHTAIATWVHRVQRVDGWWAQAVTVGYERLTGLRMPGQLPDGTFSISRSRAIGVAPGEFRARLLDETARAQLIPGIHAVLRSKPESKSLRFAVTSDGSPAGTAQFAFDEAPGGRTRITVTHEKLPSAAEREHWGVFWADWLAGVEAVSE